jgi:hypothetical protein
MGLKPGINIIDSSKSGRDNNTGTMFRDIVTGKNKYTATMPSGLNNTQYAEIADIILADSFDCWLPNPKTGTFGTKTFYCSTLEADIERIYSETLWTYKEVSFNLTEM